MSLGTQIIYRQLLERHGRIRIPMIQRDYAQGRPAEAEIREGFLEALEQALRKPANDTTLPLNLDFIYGSIEGDDEPRFLPLDGQQRLTTLFLLHWYLAWCDEEREAFERLFRDQERARFAYSVRPSSNEFFGELVGFQPAMRPEQVVSLPRLICDQPWYFRSWRLDPTIQSVLGMLDAIHRRFASARGLFSRLVDGERPAITFQLLNLQNFGLSDDLYIKMNARGKPLTALETFKARYEQELKNQFEGVTFAIGAQRFSVAEYISRRLDTTWADLFWKLRDPSSNLFDEALMNVFRAVALVTRDPEAETYLNDLMLLRNGGKKTSYTDFHVHGWLDERFTLALISLLDSWTAKDGALTAILPALRYFNELEIFERLVSLGAWLEYTDAVQFFAYVGFIVRHSGKIDPKAFQEWMRIVHNLSVNTDYNRPDDFRRSIAGLSKLLDHADNVLGHFANVDEPTGGFSPQQVAEEKLKAELVLADGAWRDQIDVAEGHGYFRGQIEFLLEFSGARAQRREGKPDRWTPSVQTAMRGQFSNYSLLAQLMFGPAGLKNLSDFRWQRALLAIGDYLLPSRRNYSFLVNSTTDQASWKRLLRGAGENATEAREVLFQLWGKLAPGQALEAQLDTIVAAATGIEPWRAALVRTPSAIGSCENRSIRRNSPWEIYLLSRTQMNGSHAELFTFCLYQNTLAQLSEKGLLAPLELLRYYWVIGIDVEPGVRFQFRHRKNQTYVGLEFRHGTYLLYVRREWLEGWPELSAVLKSSGFAEDDVSVSKEYPLGEIETALLRLVESLATAFTNN